MHSTLFLTIASIFIQPTLSNPNPNPNPNPSESTDLSTLLSEISSPPPPDPALFGTCSTTTNFPSTTTPYALNQTLGTYRSVTVCYIVGAECESDESCSLKNNNNVDCGGTFSSTYMPGSGNCVQGRCVPVPQRVIGQACDCLYGCAAQYGEAKCREGVCERTCVGRGRMVQGELPCCEEGDVVVNSQAGLVCAPQV